MSEAILKNATGRELDSFGIDMGIHRMPGENDHQYRARLIMAFSVGVTYRGKEPTEILASQATLRDYFAAKAMQSIIPDAEHLVAERMAKGASGTQAVAEASYYMADAMLAARAK